MYAPSQFPSSVSTMLMWVTKWNTLQTSLLITPDQRALTRVAVNLILLASNKFR